MHIQFTDSVAGANFAYRKGQKVDLRVDIAKSFITTGKAIALAPPVVDAPGIRRTRRGGKTAEIATAGHAESR